jgi:hypothetical protein
MARRTVKVDVPTNPDDLVGLAESIIAQHQKLEGESPGSSPLKMADIQQLQQIVAQAKPARKEAKEHARQAQVLNEQASRALGLCGDQNTLTPGTGLSVVTKVRKALELEYRGVENEMEIWGFHVEVGTASAPTKKQKPAS